MGFIRLIAIQTVCYIALYGTAPLTMQASAQMARRGRRPKGEYPEKKRVFASRMREETWEMLQLAAAKSGRSVSQEFEFRLRRSLDDDEKIESAFGDLKTFGLMKLAQTVKSMCELKNLKVHPRTPWRSTRRLRQPEMPRHLRRLRHIGVRPRHSQRPSVTNAGPPPRIQALAKFGHVIRQTLVSILFRRREPEGHRP
jgi:hypothetical protein